MRILHIIDGVGVGGGAEESLVGMLPELRNRGIDGQVICLYRRDGHEDALRAAGFQVDVLSGRTLLGRALTIRRAIRSREPDLVHASLIDACLATRVAMLGLRTPHLNSLVNTTYDPVRVSDLRIAPWKMWLLKTIDRVTSRWVNRGFHALTEAVKDEAVDVLSIPAHKVRVIPRGRDSQVMGEPTLERRNRVRESLGVADEQILILNVGRQAPQKAKLVLVEAFSRLAPICPEAVLYIAGREGKDTERLLAAIRESGASERIRLLGHRSDVADLLTAADMFVFPSYYEGLGGALVEALCMSCPAIGSDAPAIAEVLGHGKYGQVVPRGDAAGLADAMTKLATSTEERKKWATIGRDHFEATFELDAVIDRMARLYHDSVTGPASRSLLKRTLARMGRGLRNMRNRLVLLEATPEVNAREGRLPSDGLSLQIIDNLADYESAYAAYRGTPNRFAANRFAQGSLHAVLLKGEEIVAWGWASSKGVKFPMLEVGQQLQLRADERALFDLETSECHRRKGYAEALKRAMQATFSQDYLVSYVLTDNAPSLRVNEKCGFRRIGERSWRPPLPLARKVIRRG